LVPEGFALVKAEEEGLIARNCEVPASTRKGLASRARATAGVTAIFVEEGANAAFTAAMAAEAAVWLRESE
jgi:hypothetical protein